MDQRRVPLNIHLEEHLRNVSSPENLKINDQINRFREICRRHGCDRPYHHFAFGQSPFPPPPSVIAALAANASKSGYLPTAGLPELREAIAAYYGHHFGIDCEGGQVVVSPGSKEMIAMLLAVLQGPVIILTPAWVSYLPQAKILKKEVLSVRLRREDGFKLTPDLLKHALKGFPSQQKVLILNHPNNPTGVVYSESELKKLAEICRRNGVVVISDEIYALTSFEPGQFTSMGKVYPEGTIVTGGLSKDRSCGGYRLGVGIFPKEPRQLMTDVLKYAGSTYSCVAAPIQFAALSAYSMDDRIEEHMSDCRKINSLVGRKTASLLWAIAGVKTTTPHGGFYLYVDFNEQGEKFRRLGLKTCAEFCRDLLSVDHAALLPSNGLLLPDDDFSVRCSYVDYDGQAALSNWRANPPSNENEEEEFFRTNCPLIVDGVKYIGHYISEIRKGKQPKHLG